MQGVGFLRRKKFDLSVDCVDSSPKLGELYEPLLGQERWQGVSLGGEVEYAKSDSLLGVVSSQKNSINEVLTAKKNCFLRSSSHIFIRFR